MKRYINDLGAYVDSKTGLFSPDNLELPYSTQGKIGLGPNYRKALTTGAICALLALETGCACLKPAQKTELKPTKPPAVAEKPSDDEYKNLPMIERWLIKSLKEVDFGAGFMSNRNDYGL
jgi:hypothetical protein